MTGCKPKPPNGVAAATLAKAIVILSAETNLCLISVLLKSFTRLTKYAVAS
jgi:hypothetical protein